MYNAPVLLGNDALEKLEVTIDYEERQVKQRGGDPIPFVINNLRKKEVRFTLAGVDEMEIDEEEEYLPPQEPLKVTVTISNDEDEDPGDLKGFSSGSEEEEEEYVPTPKSFKPMEEEDDVPPLVESEPLVIWDGRICHPWWTLQVMKKANLVTLRMKRRRKITLGKSESPWR